MPLPVIERKIIHIPYLENEIFLRRFHYKMYQVYKLGLTLSEVDKLERFEKGIVPSEDIRNIGNNNNGLRSVNEIKEGLIR